MQFRFLRHERRAGHARRDDSGAARGSRVDPGAVSGVDGNSFSTVVESDVAVVVDRTVSWDAVGYGSHAETALAEPVDDVVPRRGRHARHLRPVLPDPEPGRDRRRTVTVRYLRPAPLAPLTKTYVVAGQQPLHDLPWTAR